MRLLYTDGERCACLSELTGVKTPADAEGSAASVKMAHTARASPRTRGGQAHIRKRRHIMSKHAVEAGWQRFLDRLKQLWGKLGQGGRPSAAAG